MGDRRRPGFITFVALLVMAAFMQPAVAEGTGDASMLQTDCASPPAIMAVDDLAAGMTGKAYTTLSGREISEYDVEILGVLPNAVYPLIDLILVRASGPALEAVGGIAGGFSGSPVYVDGKLIGAIAYGFFGNAFLAGITPAAAMIDIAGFPPSGAPLLNAGGTEALAMIESAVGPVGAPQALPIPVGVGGSARLIAELQAEVDARGLPLRLFPATAAGNTGGADSSSPGEVRPGEPMSAVLSEGDYSAFATGTATYCDGSTVIGFGHPLLWTGEVMMSMNEADVVTVVEDSTGFGNFRLVTLAEPAGRIDFDGNAGVRGISGQAAPSVPITSRVEFAEYGATRQGRTDAYMSDDLSFSLGFTSAIHLLTNLDFVSGTGFRPGSSAVEWTVEGTRQDGSPFSASFDNKYWNPFSITDSSIFEMTSFIDLLLFNSFEDVDVTAVDIGDAQLFTDRRTIDIKNVQVSTPSNPEPVSQFGFLEAQPGDTLTVEATLQPFGGDEFVETIELEIPGDFPGGFGSLSVRGGSSDFFFFDPFFEGFLPGDVSDFEGLLDYLESRDHNYDLVAELTLFEEGFAGEPPPGEGEPEPPPEPFIDANGPIGDDTVSVKETVEFDAVVTGNAFFDVNVFAEPPPNGNILQAELSGMNETGPGDPDGFGFAEFFIEGDTVLFDMTLENVDEPVIAAHIHAGEAGVDGPVVLNLDYEANGLSGAVFADPFFLEELLAFPESFYVNVHSEAYPDGAVRGQLMRPPPDIAGSSTLAYVSPSGLWRVEGYEPYYFGVADDVPFLGDWDGDGVKTPGLYRPADGYAYIRNSNDTGVADASFFMGMEGDIPIVGDWDGDGTDTFGVYRPAEGKVYLRNSNDTGTADVEYSFGMPGDVPFAGDFDGNGITDVGLHRTTTGLVYMRLTHTTGPADLEFFWGVGGDTVLAGDWNGDTVDTVGLVRASEGMFYLRNDNSTGIADNFWPLEVEGSRVIVG